MMDKRDMNGQDVERVGRSGGRATGNEGLALKKESRLRYRSVERLNEVRKPFDQSGIKRHRKTYVSCL